MVGVQAARPAPGARQVPPSPLLALLLLLHAGPLGPARARAAAVWPEAWRVLGPFPAGARSEVDPSVAFPAFVDAGPGGPGGWAGPPAFAGLAPCPPAGGRRRGDRDAEEAATGSSSDAAAARAAKPQCELPGWTLPSELQETQGGRVGWTEAAADPTDGAVALAWPAIPWATLTQAYGGGSGALTAWAVGDVAVPAEGAYLASCQGTREFWVGARKLHGDQYADGFLKTPVRLAAGPAVFTVRAMGSQTAGFRCQLEPVPAGAAAEAVAGDAVLPDIVGGRLAGGALSIAVRNLDPDAPVTVAASIDSGNQSSWLSGATPGPVELRPGQVSHLRSDPGLDR